tara:strand:+ start:1337 stop:1639 length:303 start_codon:yes stop_codon:yes gene_type:complete
MSSLNRNSLKAEFVAGTSISATKFENLIDSAYNNVDDALLLGPTGSTGNYGIFLSATATAPTAGQSGVEGELRLIEAGSTGYAYIHSNNKWFRFEGLTSF